MRELFKAMLLVVCLLNVYFAVTYAGRIFQSRSAKGNKTVSVIFVGDISFDGPVKYFAEKNKTCDYKKPFDKVRPFLAQADLRVANLESPLVPIGKTSDIMLGRKTIHHFGSAKAVEGLKYAGFDIVKLANNHYSDLGSKGMKSTKTILKKAGIAYVGAMTKGWKKKGQVPVVKEINGISLGFLAYCQQKEGCERFHPRGPAVFDRVLARKEIAALKKRADIIIVMLHWGQELFPVPTKGIRDLAASLRLLGADLIIGEHPHVVQGHECIKEALAVYSLGNFLFQKTGVDLRQFLYNGNPSEKEVERYLEATRKIFNPSQFSYMFRVTFSRKGIEEAHYLQFEIKNDPKTNCLQPTPITGEWEKVCVAADYYCYDFDLMHHVTAENLDNIHFEYKGMHSQCIRTKGEWIMDEVTGLQRRQAPPGFR